MLDPKYSIDLPVSYVRAAILLDSITDYANAPERRRGGFLYHYSYQSGYQPASILARYLDVCELGHRGISYTAGVYTLMDRGLIPEEIARTGEEFLADVQALSATDGAWIRYAPTKTSTGPAKTRPALTYAGKRRVRDLMEKWGLTGIAQTIGLSELVAY
jgi:hypothetical protein